MFTASSEHEFAEVLVHRYHQAPFAGCEIQDVHVPHPGVKFTYRKNFMPSGFKELFYRPSHPHIDQNLHSPAFHREHPLLFHKLRRIRQSSSYVRRLKFWVFA